MTKKNALTIALTALKFVNTDEANEASETITKMIESLSVKRAISDEAKAAQNAARKEKTAEARKNLVSMVAPVIRAAITSEPQTAKEIFAKCEGLPADFTVAKMQNVLLREMRPELTVTEAKGKANTYKWAE